jgi:hypothetical protein
MYSEFWDITNFYKDCISSLKIRWLPWFMCVIMKGALYWSIMCFFQRKCDMYWPKEGVETYGVIQVKLVKEDIMATYTVRTLQIRHLRVSNHTCIKVITLFCNIRN